MLEIRRDADLAQKAIGAEHRAELRIEDLERDAAVVLDVAREIDGGHAAATDLAIESVRVAQRALELIEDVAHSAAGSDALMYRRVDASGRSLVVILSEAKDLLSSARE
jgi:hypothetical protein